MTTTITPEAAQRALAAIRATQARADQALYVALFGAVAAAHDVPCLPPVIPPRQTAPRAMAKREEDAIYAACWPNKPR